MGESVRRKASATDAATALSETGPNPTTQDCEPAIL
jgi:hypothetical protein